MSHYEVGSCAPCCGETCCFCDGGYTLQVDISGISGDTGCGDLDSTYLFGPFTPSGSCAYSPAPLPSFSGSCTGNWGADVAIQCDEDTDTYLLRAAFLYLGFGATSPPSGQFWCANGATAKALIHSLCAGSQVSVPYIGRGRYYSPTTRNNCGALDTTYTHPVAGCNCTATGCLVTLLPP